MREWCAKKMMSWMSVWINEWIRLYLWFGNDIGQSKYRHGCTWLRRLTRRWLLSTAKKTSENLCIPSQCWSHCGSSNKCVSLSACKWTWLLVKELHYLPSLRQCESAKRNTIKQRVLVPLQLVHCNMPSLPTFSRFSKNLVIIEWNV